MNKSDLLEKIKMLLNRMKDHETPENVTSKEELGPLLKDSEDLLETVSVLKYLIEEEEVEDPASVPDESDGEIVSDQPENVSEDHDESSTINEAIAPPADNTSIGDKLEKDVVNDLQSAIGLNERFLFINELFDGDGAAYQTAFDQLNSFADLPEALNYIRTELSDKYTWDQEQESTISFYSLIEKRYAE